MKSKKISEKTLEIALKIMAGWANCELSFEDEDDVAAAIEEIESYLGSPK